MHYCKGNFSRLPYMFALIDPHKNGISITPALATLFANKICIFLLENNDKMHGTSFSHAPICEWSGLFCLKNWILYLIVFSHVGCRQVGEVIATHEWKNLRKSNYEIVVHPPARLVVKTPHCAWYDGKINCSLLMKLLLNKPQIK